MILETITGPADLRELTPEQLDQLAVEIRAFIVQSVAATGGHLGSNLGAVELTLALHRVFDSPRDWILWDTGHQAYVHKIVTGRADGFRQLRQKGGLSGYPSRAESPHDHIENSHASTVLSYAFGLAVARDADPEQADRRIVAVIGDGSMTGGMAYEALNNLGHSGRHAIIVLNDNGRSYAPTVSQLSQSLTWIRLNPTYMRRQRRLEQMVGNMPVAGPHLERGMKAAKAAIREMWEPVAFFETLGVRYAGPIDGHDVAAVEAALRQAGEWNGPVVVHVLTHKGHGYPPAEEDEEKCLHDISAFDPETGLAFPSSTPGYTQIFGDAMVEEGARDERIVAITAAMPGSTGLLPFAEQFPDRFVDVGIAEQHAVTAAAGMAMGGMRPVVAIYSTFLNRAWDQIVNDVALHQLPVVFCIDRAGITGEDGASTHGVYDLALLTKVPGMTVLAPSSDAELRAMLHHALTALDGPVAIRWPKGAARLVGADDLGDGLRARRLRTGADVCFVAVGRMVGAALDAADVLARQAIEATVWDVRCASALDPDMVADASRHGLVITAEDGIASGGVGSAVAAAVADATPVDRRSPRVVQVGTPLAFITQGKGDDILSDLGLDGPGLAAAAIRGLSPAASPFE